MSEDRATGYAAGIFEIAKAEGEADRVADELFRIANAFAASSELQEVLTDPHIPIDRKSGVVDDLLGDRASPLTANLVSLIVASGRAKDLVDVATQLVQQASKTRGKTTAEVRSATELDPATIDRLTQALSRATGRPLEVRVIVDPAVIGGLVVRVGDTVIDGSLKGRFESLRETLEAQ